MFKWEKIGDNKVLVEIEVPKEEVNEALEQAYRKMAKDINLPGFRKGKVPRKIIESRYGPEVFYNDALEILVDPAYAKAVKECELEPINQPELELVQMEQDKPLLFKVTVEVKPEVKLPEYRGVSVEQVKDEITAENVDSYLDSLREQHARLVTVEDGELQEKDMAVIDFSGKIDGEVFEGGEAENYSLEIGSASFIPGFEEQLLGAGTGEEREVKVTFPEDYQKEELAGKEAVFSVKVKEIKRPQVPELDDAFVQELSEEFSTVQEFREDIEKKLQENLQHRKKVELETKVIEKVAAEAEVEVPDVLVERELDNMIGEMEYYLRMQGLNMEQYGQMVEGGLEKIREERRPEAESRARANLVLDAIIKEEQIEATEEEIEEKIKEVAQKQDMNMEEVKVLFSRDGRMDMITHEIRYRRAIDILVEHAQVQEVEEEQEKAFSEVTENEHATAEKTEDEVASEQASSSGEQVGEQ